MRNPGRRRLFTALVGLSLLGARANAFELQDTLRGGTRGNAVGGHFEGDGWHTDDRRDVIWFPLPRLVEGAIEFTVTGIRTETLVLTDHEIFALYEAGHGIAEPIRYGPEFRGNHYKCLMRVYGQPEAARVGAQKLMWGMCPSGAPGYGDCGCASFFEEPVGGDPTWNGEPSRVRVEWGGGLTRLLRNGVEAVQVNWADSGLVFGPSELHFTLGSPRAAAVDDAGLPVGVVFSDLSITGVEGELAVCPGGVPGDAGAGPVPVPGEGLLPTDDATVDAATPGGPLADPTDLAVESAGGAPAQIAYLRFDVPHPVRRAVLHLTARAEASAEGDGASVHAVDDTDWDEATVSFATRPIEDAESLGETGATAPDGTYAIDVTAATHAGPVAFALLGGENGSHFSSKEDAGGARAPRLEVEYAPDVSAPDAQTPVSPDGQAPPAPDAHAGSGPRPTVADATRPDPADVYAAEANGVGARGDCNCRAGAQAPRSVNGWLILGLVWAARVRRARGRR